jgi:hypothetical protein
MKSQLLFALILTVSNTYGQNLSNLQNTLQKLLDKTEFQLDTSGLAQLPKLEDYICNSRVPNRNAHVCDLNQDGLNDLIYTGSCAPYSETVIFLNEGKSFKQVYSSGGAVIAIEKKGDITEVIIFAEACCCMHFSDLFIAQIGKDDTCQEQSIAFHTDTELSLGQVIITERMSGTVRTTPKVNNKPQKDECTDEQYIGNTLITVKNEAVTVLNKKGKWVLVLVAEDSEQSLIGWMKTM